MEQNKYNIFVSYCRADIDVVMRMVGDIHEKTNARCWVDWRGIESGAQFEDVIVKAIDNVDVVLFVLSDSSMSSSYVKKEIAYARNTGKKVIPIVVDGGKLRGWFLFQFGQTDYIDINVPIQYDKFIRNLQKWFSTENAIQEKNATIEPIAENTSDNTVSRIDTSINSPKQLSYNKRYFYTIACCSVLFLLSLLLPLVDNQSAYYFFILRYGSIVKKGVVTLSTLYGTSFLIYSLLVSMIPIFNLRKKSNKYSRVLTTLVGCSGLIYVLPLCLFLSPWKLNVGSAFMLVGILGMIFTPAFLNVIDESASKSYVVDKKYVYAVVCCTVLLSLLLIMPFICNYLLQFKLLSRFYARALQSLYSGFTLYVFVYWLVIYPVLRLKGIGNIPVKIISAFIGCMGVLSIHFGLSNYLKFEYGIAFMLVALVGMMVFHAVIRVIRK